MVGPACRRGAAAWAEPPGASTAQPSGSPARGFVRRRRGTGMAIGDVVRQQAQDVEEYRCGRGTVPLVMRLVVPFLPDPLGARVILLLENGRRPRQQGRRLLPLPSAHPVAGVDQLLQRLAAFKVAIVIDVGVA